MAETNPSSEKPKIIHTVELNEPRPNILVSPGEYKGNPMLHLVFLDGNAKLSFGPGKARMILHSLPEIVAFYNMHKGRLDK